jgi:hypothetical protein
VFGKKRRGPAPAELVESASLRRERAALQKLRLEVGDRLQEVRRREIALEKRAAELGEAGVVGSSPEEIGEELDRRREELEQRERELDERVNALAEREQAVAGREKLAAGPEATEAALKELERRAAEVAQAEELFLRTRRELVERSDEIASKEADLLRRERELESAGRPAGPVALPPVSDDRFADAPSSLPASPASGFSSGLRDLERHGTRKPRSL